MHEDVTMWMSLVLDGEATQEQRARLFDHLSVCAPCARRWAQWQAYDIELISAPTLMPPAGFTANVMSRIEQAKSERSRSTWIAPGLLLLWGGAIAISATIVALAVLWGLRHPLELSILVASMAQLLSSVSALMGGIRVLLGGFDPLALGLASGALLGCTSLLTLFWYWAVHRQFAGRPRRVGLDG